MSVSQPPSDDNMERAEAAAKNSPPNYIRRQLQINKDDKVQKDADN